MYWEENPDTYVVMFLEPQTNKNVELSDKIERLAHMCWYAEHNMTEKVKEWF